MLAYEGGASGFPATATPDDVSGDVTATGSNGGDGPGDQSAAGTSGRRFPGQRLRRIADVSAAAARGYANHLRARHREVAARVGVALGDILYR